VALDSPPPSLPILGSSSNLTSKGTNSSIVSGSSIRKLSSARVSALDEFRLEANSASDAVVMAGRMEE